MNPFHMICYSTGYLRRVYIYQKYFKIHCIYLQLILKSNSLYVFYLTPGMSSYNQPKKPSFVSSIQLLFIFASSIYVGCYQFMASMAKPVYSQTGALVDGGLDLNMESGMAE